MFNSATPWTVTCKTCLPFTISWNFPNFMSIESVMLSISSSATLFSSCPRSFPVSGSSSHVRKWELDNKKGWAPKNWCFWAVVLEKTLESPLDNMEIKWVNPKGYQSWIFTGGTDAEDEAPILWPPDAKSWFIGKDTDAGKDWGQEEKGVTEMVGWHHRLNGHEFDQALGDGEGLGSLVCCSPLGHKESDTEWLNNKGICHLPRQRLNLVLRQLLTFSTP